MPGSELALGIVFGPDTEVPQGSVWERQVGKPMMVVVVTVMVVMVVPVEMTGPMC